MNFFVSISSSDIYILAIFPPVSFLASNRRMICHNFEPDTSFLARRTTQVSPTILAATGPRT
ncbi:hypothetical protein M433DRAFT_195193 [Acidomyces richmondensis BFW]|nr:MAG: hypothetical protein FE78DRAFT_347227 [Acidomyces sp. 'richmondensis']KYG46569.1 hypothetical protein M433DRAFT_195193 [Acidomyces richmondensis BFW]